MPSSCPLPGTYLLHRQRLEGMAQGVPIGTRSSYFVDAVPGVLHLVIYLCSEEASRSATDKRGRSTAVHECQRSCENQRDHTEQRLLGSTYAKGLRTALQGALHVTGSYCSRGVSGFSFSGV